MAWQSEVRLDGKKCKNSILDRNGGGVVKNNKKTNSKILKSVAKKINNKNPKIEKETGGFKNGMKVCV